MYNFFVALALFDFLSLVFSISGIIHILNPATSSFAAAVWYSYFEVLLINSTMGTSVLIVVCITLDRYISVCHPYMFKTFHTPRFCKLGIGCAFIVSSIVWLPTCFLKTPAPWNECESFFALDDIPNNDTILWVACQRDDFAEYSSYIAYAWIREIVISFLPIAIVIILNGFLVKYFVEKHKHRTVSTTTTTRSPVAIALPSRQVGDANLKGLLKAIMICFFVTLLPAGIFNAVYSERLSTSFKYELFRAYANTLELLNHALNFYLYILLCKPIRSALPSLFSNFKTKVAEKLQVPKLAVINVPESQVDFNPTFPSKSDEVRQKEESKEIAKNNLRSNSDPKQFSDLSNGRENNYQNSSTERKNVEGKFTKGRGKEMMLQKEQANCTLAAAEEIPQELNT